MTRVIHIGLAIILLSAAASITDRGHAHQIRDSSGDRARWREDVSSVWRMDVTEGPTPPAIDPPLPEGWTHFSPVLPKGFWNVRAQRRGADANAIVNEFGGLTWLFMSHDGGFTWRRVYLPDLPPPHEGRWVIIPHDQQLPLVDGDTVTIELGATLDKEQRWTALAVATAKLPELSRDTDGDGLTDLFEIYLGTNPDSEDSDGDGIPDGLDPMPLVPADQQGILPAALIYEATFVDHQAVLGRGVSVDDNGSALLPDDGLVETVCLVGNAALLRAPAPPVRFLVYPDWGHFCPAQFDLDYPETDSPFVSHVNVETTPTDFDFFSWGNGHYGSSGHLDHAGRSWSLVVDDFLAVEY